MCSKLAFWLSKSTLYALRRNWSDLIPIIWKFLFSLSRLLKWLQLIALGHLMYECNSISCKVKKPQTWFRMKSASELYCIVGKPWDFVRYRIHNSREWTILFFWGNLLETHCISLSNRVCRRCIAELKKILFNVPNFQRFCDTSFTFPFPRNSSLLETSASQFQLEFCCSDFFVWTTPINCSSLWQLADVKNPHYVTTYGCLRTLPNPNVDLDTVRRPSGVLIRFQFLAGEKRNWHRRQMYCNVAIWLSNEIVAAGYLWRNCCVTKGVQSRHLGRLKVVR